MKRSVRWIIIAVVVGVVSVAAAAESARNDYAGPLGATEAAYAARLAANNAAAEAWRAAHPEGIADDASSNNEPPVADFGCPEGTQFWQRDSISPLCASLCSADQDCGPDEGRCRILDVASDETMPEMLLVDDLTPDEVEWAMERTLEETPVLMLCDPFWDIEGATDADLVLEAAAAAAIDE